MNWKIFMFFCAMNQFFEIFSSDQLWFVQKLPKDLKHHQIRHIGNFLELYRSVCQWGVEQRLITNRPTFNSHWTNLLLTYDSLIFWRYWNHKIPDNDIRSSVYVAHFLNTYYQHCVNTVADSKTFKIYFGGKEFVYAHYIECKRKVDLQNLEYFLRDEDDDDVEQDLLFGAECTVPMFVQADNRDKGGGDVGDDWEIV